MRGTFAQFLNRILFLKYSTADVHYNELKIAKRFKFCLALLCKIWLYKLNVCKTTSIFHCLTVSCRLTNCQNSTLNIMLNYVQPFDTGLRCVSHVAPWKNNGPYLVWSYSHLQSTYCTSDIFYSVNRKFGSSTTNAVCFSSWSIFSHQATIRSNIALTSSE